MLIEGQEQSNEKADSYSLFLYAVRSPLTRDYYLRCLRIFINHINLLPNVTIEERCNLFAASGIKDPSWAFHCIIKFLQSQRERVEKEDHRRNSSELREIHKIILRDDRHSDCMEKDYPRSAKKQNVCR